jgi:hypothetical protein
MMKFNTRNRTVWRVETASRGINVVPRATICVPLATSLASRVYAGGFTESIGQVYAGLSGQRFHQLA